MFTFKNPNIRRPLFSKKQFFGGGGGGMYMISVSKSAQKFEAGDNVTGGSCCAIVAPHKIGDCKPSRVFWFPIRLSLFSRKIKTGIRKNINAPPHASICLGESSSKNDFTATHSAWAVSE
jgi:hypothetical protein